MAFTKCSRCGESFHLKVTSSELVRELKHKEDAGEVRCIRCFKTVNEYDVIETITPNESS